MLVFADTESDNDGKSELDDGESVRVNRLEDPSAGNSEGSKDCD